MIIKSHLKDAAELFVNNFRLICSARPSRPSDHMVRLDRRKLSARG